MPDPSPSPSPSPSPNLTTVEDLLTQAREKGFSVLSLSELPPPDKRWRANFCKYIGSDQHSWIFGHGHTIHEAIINALSATDSPPHVTRTKAPYRMVSSNQHVVDLAQVEITLEDLDKELET